VTIQYKKHVTTFFCSTLNMHLEVLACSHEFRFFCDTCRAQLHIGKVNVKVFNLLL